MGRKQYVSLSIYEGKRTLREREKGYWARVYQISSRKMLFFYRVYFTSIPTTCVQGDGERKRREGKNDVSKGMEEEGNTKREGWEVAGTVVKDKCISYACTGGEGLGKV